MDGQPVARQRALKTRDMATCGDRYLAHPPWKANPAGLGIAWKANGAATHGIQVLSLPPIWNVNRTGVRLGFEYRWFRKEWGSKPQHSAKYSAPAGCTLGTRESISLAPFIAGKGLVTHTASYAVIAAFDSLARFQIRVMPSLVTERLCKSCVLRNMPCSIHGLPTTRP